MIIYKLKIKLLSDTTFGRGDGVAGLVDQEVEHDAYGFPYLRGRTLKGLLSEECDNLIAILPEESRKRWEQIACYLFGNPGSTLDTISSMYVGDACLPEDLRKVVAYQMKTDKKLTKTDILESLTTIRRQTAVDMKTGVPDKKSLRSSRVILRENQFTADLCFETQPSDDAIVLLSVGTLALKHLGSGRNRGLGYVRSQLFNYKDEEVTGNFIQHFI